MVAAADPAAGRLPCRRCRRRGSGSVPPSVGSPSTTSAAGWRRHRRARSRSRSCPAACPSAVLVPLVEIGGETHVLFIKRPETMSTHKGEIAFPGGKSDPAVDPDLLATALREAREEIGLDPAGGRDRRPARAASRPRRPASRSRRSSGFLGPPARARAAIRPRWCGCSKCRSRSCSTPRSTTRSAGTGSSATCRCSSSSWPTRRCGGRRRVS